MLKQFFSIFFITLVSANNYPLLNKRDPDNKNRYHRHRYHTRNDYYTRNDYL